MADVARHAGVSAITVSRALRHPEQVSQATRDQISAAMAELGYVPNLIAGGLAATRTRIVSVIVPYITHGVFAEAIQGVSDALRDRGYCVLLGNSAGSMVEEEQIVRILLGHRPAGVVIQGANHTEVTRRLLSNASIPVVEIGTLPRHPIDMAVGYSNFEAARTMTSYLIDRGHRRIGLVTARPTENDRAADRLAGYRAALSKAKIKYDPDLVVHTEFGIGEGRAAFHALMQQKHKPDAIFCASDLWAAGMIGECIRSGIAVPDDIAIAGFNDQEIATEIVPSITTIRVPRYQIGRIAGSQIIKRLDGHITDERTDLGFELIPRASA
ncbi:LacI family DNA-binding transcriptional regulator [Leptospira interrogans]